MDSYNVIGVMSGTSLDGLDLAYCTFQLTNKREWNFTINTAITINYSSELLQKLKKATTFNGLDLMLLHNELGDFIGLSINNFIQKNNINRTTIDAISSHGHTIFHQVDKKLTTQIGNGANISSLTKLPVICDFRTADVALGGQGAPLVPIGDQLLFAEYDFCINLGGIANISYQENNQRVAYDICPVNIVMNKLALELDQPYDKNGDFAKSGIIHKHLLLQLNQVDYYKKSPPKSLGIENITQSIFPILDSFNISNEDKLATFVEHISIQIANTLTANKKVFITGGGTFNSYLIERIENNYRSKIIIPPPQLIDFKEALIFAFLGVLRLRKEINCLKSVTGASQDNIGGCIYQTC